MANTNRCKDNDAASANNGPGHCFCADLLSETSDVKK